MYIYIVKQLFEKNFHVNIVHCVHVQVHVYSASNQSRQRKND